MARLFFTVDRLASSAIQAWTAPSTAPCVIIRTGRWPRLGTTRLRHPARYGSRKHGPTFDHWQSRFGYEELVQGCNYGTFYFVQSYQWDAGQRILHPHSAPNAPHCEYQPGHTTFTKATTTATTFAAGFSIGSPISFNGSVQTGYSATAAVSFSFRKHGEICGADAQPGTKAPGVIVGAGPK
jgi:hypothetical protein